MTIKDFPFPEPSKCYTYVKEKGQKRERGTPKKCTSWKETLEKVLIMMMKPFVGKLDPCCCEMFSVGIKDLLVPRF